MSKLALGAVFGPYQGMDSAQRREAFSRNLKRVLSEKGLDSNDLARAISVDQTVAWRYVSGRNVPHRKRLEEICNFLGVSRSELLRDEESTPEGLDAAVPAAPPKSERPSGCSAFVPSQTQVAVASRVLSAFATGKPLPPEEMGWLAEDVLKNDTFEMARNASEAARNKDARTGELVAHLAVHLLKRGRRDVDDT